MHYSAVKRFGILFFVLLVIGICGSAQPLRQFTHYSVDNGLSENHVLCMHQDKRGNMWFGTYYGLNKFDGYKFSSFRGNAPQQYRLLNYRVNRIREDRQGYLWIQTNDDRMYRFDPTTETFMPVPQCIDKYSDYTMPLNRISLLADGSIWLYNGNKENSDCFSATNRPDGSLDLHYYAKANGMLKADYLNQIYVDRRKNTWWLSSDGLNVMPAGQHSPKAFFNTHPQCPVLSVLETATACYFGAEKGKLLIVNARGERTLLQTPTTHPIVEIKALGSHEIVLVSASNDFYVMHTRTLRFTPYRIAGKSCTVYSAFSDRNGNLWIDSNRSMGIRFDARSRTLSYQTVDTTAFVNQQTTKFYALENGKDLWLQLRSGGLYRYNETTRKLENIHSAQGEDLSGLIHSAMFDQQGNLWYSTYLQGVDKMTVQQSPFRFTRPFDLQGFSMRNEVRALCADSHGRLWVGTKKGQLCLYSPQRQLLGTVGPDGKLNSKNYFSAAPYHIAEDHTGRIWVGTKGQGLFCFTPQRDGNFEVKNYRYNPDDIYSLSHDAVYAVFEDSKKRLWIATFGGGINLLTGDATHLRFVNHRNTLTHYPIDQCSRVRYLTQDRHGALLAGTT